MSNPAFRLVSAPAALAGGPGGWAAAMLRDGEVALLVGADSAAASRVAHDLGQVTIQIVRAEETAADQDATVIAYAASLPLIWIAPAFSDRVASWARERGPMTLLVETPAALSEEERRRIDRFVAILARQSE
ncbi:hypothetical protein [Conexibacter sp. DBS9H8]|uniref:hypothetical protein n=1 Tax=Conexibacter sp. DBS9H8 TaxID=2937801 RepID=UPI00200F63C7|nr:hypothetical protein [Conexibacter sp. DBS9H8]